jgi:hypothetical protein
LICEDSQYSNLLIFDDMRCVNAVVLVKLAVFRVHPRILR